MIINIRGTNGSGKSTLVREIMSYYDRDPIFGEGRKQPIGYRLEWKGSNLFVPGHYETACGGCDTIKTLDGVYNLIRELHEEHTLYEGIMVNDDVTRAVELSKEHEMIVIALTTPLEDCFKGIRERRELKGNIKEIATKSTTNRFRGMRRRLERLREVGVKVEEHDRYSALKRIKELLRIV